MTMTGDLAARIGALLGVDVTGLHAVGAQHGYRHLTARLADGREAFVKAASGPASRPASRPGAEQATAFAAEANGLRWLAEAALADGGAAAVPEVLGVDDSMLVIELLPPGRPSPRAAHDFGGQLARTHAAGAPAFGAPWTGFLASLPLDNTPLDNTPLDSTPPDNAAETGWGTWYAARRIVPYLRLARDSGALSRADTGLVESVIERIGDLAGPPEPPSRIHGDLWSGNVLWSGGRGWLIDPAAHGGHRETDLAMLALFGAPHLDAILRGYTETAPLSAGWRARVPLHQLHPLLVHCCLFGSGYTAQLSAVARATLRA
jgi:fructosamine-3-kinase